MTTVAPLVSLELHGSPLSLRLLRVRGHERIHSPFRYHVIAEVLEGTVDVDALLGTEATLTLLAEVPRKVTAVVDAIEVRDAAITIELAPEVARLVRTCDHRVFVDQDALSIAKAVLQEHGIAVDVRVQRTLAKRSQCVQSFESHLDFVSRILAEEGIVWHAETAVAEQRIVLTDTDASHDAIEGDHALPYRSGDAEALLSEEAVFAACLRHSARAETASLRDYDFLHPQLDLTVDATTGDGALEDYDAPGGYAEQALGKELAAIRLDQLRAPAIRLEATSTCRRLAVGRTFELTNTPRQDMAGPWLVHGLELELSQLDSESEKRLSIALVAVPADGSHRVKARQQPPVVGLQGGVITGASGTEIHTEENGSVKALLRWDRRSAEDDTSSTWCRVAHPAMSGGFFLPRLGWEAMMFCRHGSADAPWVIGRCDNGKARPAEKLPGKKVRSAFGTPTTPGGGGSNRVRTDDTAGNEHVTINASKNYNEKTKGNKASSTKGTQKHKVSGKQTLDFETNQSLKVDSSQAVSVGGMRKLGTSGGIVIDAGSELATVGGVRQIQTGGDLTTQTDASFIRLVGGAKVEIDIAAHNRHVSAVSTVGVGGVWLEASPIVGITVGGVSALGCSAYNVTASGGYSLKASGITENAASQAFKAVACVNKGATAVVHVGSMKVTTPTLVISASGSLTIDGGGGTLKITPGGITVSGDFKVSGKAHFNQKASHQ